RQGLAGQTTNITTTTCACTGITRRCNTNGKGSKLLLSPNYAEQNRYLVFSYSWPDYLLQSATLHYDAGGTGSVNRTWSFTYDASSRLSTMTAPDSGVNTFAWTTYTRSDGQVLPLVT